MTELLVTFAIIITIGLIWSFTLDKKTHSTH